LPGQNQKLGLFSFSTTKETSGSYVGVGGGGGAAAAAMLAVLDDGNGYPQQRQWLSSATAMAILDDGNGFHR